MNIVEKYGGTSVGTIEQITAIAQHVKEMKEEGHQLVVVASAMGKTTNQLIAMANQISDRDNKRELDFPPENSARSRCWRWPSMRWASRPYP